MIRLMVMVPTKKGKKDQALCCVPLAINVGRCQKPQIITYSTVQTGPKTQFGGVSAGCCRLSYQSFICFSPLKLTIKLPCRYDTSEKTACVKLYYPPNLTHPTSKDVTPKRRFNGISGVFPLYILAVSKETFILLRSVNATAARLTSGVSR